MDAFIPVVTRVHHNTYYDHPRAGLADLPTIPRDPGWILKARDFALPDD
jgi:hypothetical protein